MSEFMTEQPPWYVLGPCIGIVVIALAALMNVRIGVLGGWSDLIERATGRNERVGWKGFFVLGIALGGLAYLAVGGATTGDGYGWLTRSFGEDSRLAVGGLLALGGVLIGFGAKTASGCTAGNGLGGTSFGSPSAFAATGTFMATAIAGAFLIRAIA